MEDAQIVELYLRRDESAIVCTSEKYGARLRHIADRILEDGQAAEECENDTYLEAWNRIPPNEPRSWFFAFLGRITRHLAIDRYRKRHSLKRDAAVYTLTQELEQCIPDGSDAQEKLEARELSAQIDLFLSRCTAPQRSVFVRRYWYMDSIPEIAARFGYSQSKVKSMLFRLRERLRNDLEKEGYTV